MVHARKNTTKTRQTQRSTKMLRKIPENRPRIQKSQKSPERTHHPKKSTINPNPRIKTSTQQE
nr:tetratricopeptide repeat protein [Methanothermobacter marburgensis]